tara:strand:- start:31 stop:501 length:471 start_codon:yes stop_codon:yes gene_type:complete
MIKVNVILEEKAWSRYLIHPEKYIKNKISLIVKNSKFLTKKKVAFTIALSGSKKIKTLNKKFRKKDKATDVLSFPFYKENELRSILRTNKEKLYLGDVIINFYKIKKVNFYDHFDSLWVHGFLHLLGYKHKKDSDFDKMQSKEKKILNLFKKNVSK